MTKQFLVTVELPTEPPAALVELLRAEIEQHALAIVPFYTHQQADKVTCVLEESEAIKAFRKLRESQITRD